MTLKGMLYPAKASDRNFTWG